MSVQIVNLIQTNCAFSSGKRSNMFGQMINYIRKNGKLYLTSGELYSGKLKSIFGPTVNFFRTKGKLNIFGQWIKHIRANV